MPKENSSGGAGTTSWVLLKSRLSKGTSMVKFTSPNTMPRKVKTTYSGR
jgi:hypothetical protein